MLTLPTPRAGLLALGLGLAASVSLAARAGHAEQFTLFDVTFDYTWEDAVNATPSKSHYYVRSSQLNAQRPTNWVSPIDYRNGKVYIHLEVLEKPAGGQRQGWALCYVGGGSYGCPYTDYYEEAGVYDREVAMTSFYNNATLDWTKGITQVDLVYTINDSGSGHVHNFPDLKDQTTPTKVRIAMVQVSQGATYDPSQLGGGGTGGTATGGAGGAGAGGTAGGGGGGGAGVGMGGGGAASAGAGSGAGGSPSGGAGGAAGSPSAPMAGSASMPGAGGALASAGAPTEPLTPPVEDAGGCSVGRPASSASSDLTLLAALALVSRARRRR